MPDAIELPEILAALSLATDLANGQPFETSLRTSLLATALAEAAGGSSAQIANAYYAALLRAIGCTATSHDAGAAFEGDDNALHRTFAPVDHVRLLDVLPPATRIGRGRGVLHRVRAITTFMRRARGVYGQIAASACEVALRLATRLEMSADVIEALSHMYERWDGTGAPEGRAGEEISWTTRVVQVALIAELHTRTRGPQAAIAVLRRRAGGQLDPSLVKVFTSNAKHWLERLTPVSVWDSALAKARSFPSPLAASVDTAVCAFADFTDLKSIYTLGHSSAVAALAEAAAACLGMSDAERTLVRHAALLHDLGKVGVPCGVWEKPGPLTAAEWELVRLHPYYTARVLSRSPLLTPLAEIAGAHHERLDGSGYPRSVPAVLISRASRVLAAADHYEGSIEARPHRAALTRSEASSALHEQAKNGRLDRDVVDAVLEAAGHERKAVGRAPRNDLTDREIEILQWVARGNSNKEVGQALSISPRTVQQHIKHIYDKIGARTRAGAALYAIEHGLLPTEPKP